MTHEIKNQARHIESARIDDKATVFLSDGSVRTVWVCKNAGRMILAARAQASLTGPWDMHAPLQIGATWDKLATGKDKVTIESIKLQPMKPGGFECYYNGKPWSHEFTIHGNITLSDATTAAREELRIPKHKFANVRRFMVPDQERIKELYS